LNAQKILVAGIGLAVLAGLALHQGAVREPVPEERSILVGTALEAATQDTSAQDESAIEPEMLADPCGSEAMANGDSAGEPAGCGAETTADTTAENPPPPSAESQPG
jgi:hypothetical protein